MSETAYRFESCRGHSFGDAVTGVGAVSEQVGDPGHWAPVAQLDRALAYGARGWGFESLRAHLGFRERTVSDVLLGGARSSVG